MRNAPLNPKPKIAPKAKPPIDIPAFELRPAVQPAEEVLRIAHEATVFNILRAVAKQWRLHRNEIKSPRRQAYLVEPRHVVFMLARVLTSKSYPYIGMKVGHRDHTSVIHGAANLQWLSLRLSSELKRTDPLSLWVKRAHEILHPVSNADCDQPELPAPAEPMEQQAQQEEAHDQGSEEMDADILG